MQDTEVSEYKAAVEDMTAKLAAVAEERAGWQRELVSQAQAAEAARAELQERLTDAEARAHGLQARLDEEQAAGASPG